MRGYFNGCFDVRLACLKLIACRRSVYIAILSYYRIAVLPYCRTSVLLYLLKDQIVRLNRPISCLLCGYCSSSSDPVRLPPTGHTGKSQVGSRELNNSEASYGRNTKNYLCNFSRLTWRAQGLLTKLGKSRSTLSLLT